jgi:hypothetical protein
VLMDWLPPRHGTSRARLADWCIAGVLARARRGLKRWRWLVGDVD